MSDTHSIIAASIANIREDSPADGGPEPVSSGDTPDMGDDTGSHDSSADEGDTPAAPVVGDTGDNTPAAPVAPAKPEEKPDDKAKETDDIDAEPEFKLDATGRKQVNRIPQPRVKKMVENAVTRAVQTETAKFTEQLKGYESRVQEFEGLGQIMATDDGRFMQMLAKAYPQYEKYVQPPQSAVPAATPTNDPEPPPDGQLSDGTPAYTREGFQKHQEWQARQVEQRVLGKVSEKYKWLDDQHAAEKAREAQRPVVRQQMAEAMEQWDGFKDNFDTILTELQQDSAEAERTGRAPRLSLHDAYRTVMTRKSKEERDGWTKERERLAVDRNKMRQEILAELAGRPTSTAATPVVPATRTEEGDDAPSDSREIIRRAIATIK